MGGATHSESAIPGTHSRTAFTYHKTMKPSLFIFRPIGGRVSIRCVLWDVLAYEEVGGGGGGGGGAVGWL